MDLNKTIIAGRTVREPDFCTTPSGLSVCGFTVATSKHWTAASGEKREDTLFIRCSAFGKTAEGIRKWLTKGTEVFVEGYLKNNEYTSKSGEQKTSIELVVEKWQPCSWDQAKSLLARGNGAQQMPSFSPAFTPQQQQQQQPNVPVQQMAPEQRYAVPRVDDADVPIEDLPF